MLLSGALFTLRGLAVQLRMDWGMAAPTRYFSYGVDTVLLAAALLLVVSLPAAMFANGWLLAKLGLLVAYIVAGSLALKRAPGQSWKRAFLLLALVLYASMFLIARRHDPLAPLRAVGL